MRMKHTRPLPICHAFYRVMPCGRGVQEEGASACWVGWYHRKREDRLCPFTRSVLPFFLGSARQRVSGMFDSEERNPEPRQAHLQEPMGGSLGSSGLGWVDKAGTASCGLCLWSEGGAALMPCSRCIQGGISKLSLNSSLGFLQ